MKSPLDGGARSVNDAGCGDMRCWSWRPNTMGIQRRVCRWCYELREAARRQSQIVLVLRALDAPPGPILPEFELYRIMAISDHFASTTVQASR